MHYNGQEEEEMDKQTMKRITLRRQLENEQHKTVTTWVNAGASEGLAVSCSTCDTRNIICYVNRVGHHCT